MPTQFNSLPFSLSGSILMNLLSPIMCHPTSFVDCTVKLLQDILFDLCLNYI